jgi:hypothetical protein
LIQSSLPIRNLKVTLGHNRQKWQQFELAEPGCEFHPLKSSAFHGALFRQQPHWYYIRSGDFGMQFAIKDIVKGNKAHFSLYRSGNMFYTVTVNGTKWMFPVSLEDIGGASLFAEMKAITLMRYIRKAPEDKTFVKAA